MQLEPNIPPTMIHGYTTSSSQLSYVFSSHLTSLDPTVGPTKHQHSTNP